MLSVLAPKTDFDRPSIVYAFLQSPMAFVARIVYEIITSVQTLPTTSITPISIVCISDTHTLKTKIPHGDLLIHAGDLTNAGTIKELQEQIDWLDSLPHRHKVAIAGNHDTYLDPRSRQTLAPDEKSGLLDWKSIHYLQHSSITLAFPDAGNRTLNIYGAPLIPACGGPEFAFQYARGQDAWSDTIPIGTDVLVTHTPPKWHRDLPAGLGCEHLLAETWRVQPRLHVCGHIHAGSGSSMLSWSQCQAAYERISQRRKTFFGFLEISTWLDLMRLCVFGVRDLTMLWGGGYRRGILVNAALMSQETGSLDNSPCVVHI